MKKWGEGKAAAMAVVVSAGALLGVFGFAAIMRNAGQRIPAATFATTVPAAILPGTLAADASNGRHLFLMNCAHCHGDDARGNGEDGDGPDLFALRIGNARIATVIRGGIPDEMPSFAKKHGPADIADLTGYLRTLQ